MPKKVKAYVKKKRVPESIIIENLQCKYSNVISNLKYNLNMYNIEIMIIIKNKYINI